MNKETALQRLKTKAFSGPAGAVFRGMATLAVGNIAARIIGIAAIPILTRLYSPEDFGALAIFTSLISILAPIITLRYVLALPLPRRDGMAINLLTLSAGLMLCMSLLVGLVLWVFGTQLLGLFSMKILAPYWWLIVVGLIGGSGYELLSLWATRKRAYKHIAQTTATQSLLGNLTKLGLGFLSIKPLGLLIGQAVSSSAGITSLWLRFRADFARNRRFISISRIKAVAGRYRHFPIYRLPSQFLLVFSTQSLVLFFAATYGAQDTGQLSMALTVIALPLSILGHSVSQAYYAETAKIGVRNPDKLIEVTQIVTKKLFIIALAPFLVLMLGGEYLFAIFFGKQWIVSGNFASLLSVYLVAQFVTAPVMNIFNIMNKQAIFLAINMTRTALMVSIFLVAAPLLSLRSIETIFIYSIVMAVFYSGIYLFVIHQIKNLQIKSERNAD